MNKCLTIVFMLTCFLGLNAEKNNDKVLAFPGAEGAGKYTTGGRGGVIYTVTNLNDDGPGSLRDGIQKHGARIIVFAVDGYIDLESQLVINNNDITIAGESAPGAGICLRGEGLRINADNIIIRYLRVRPGDLHKKELDAFTSKYHKNIIIDHCSFSWATDEVCSVYDNENVTIQWCLISESLNKSYHSKGEHGYGGIWGGMKTSFLHNLLAHHKSRNPRLQGCRYTSTPETENAEIVNNVIYNWKSKCIYAGEQGTYNIINNYIKPGPATSKSAAKRIIEPYSPYGNFVLEGNVLEGYEAITKNNLEGVQMEEDSIPFYFKKKSSSISCYRPESATKAYKNVLTSVGASKYRDAADARVIKEVETGTAHSEFKGIINSPSDVQGWPELKTAQCPEDSDKDGIPDEWEIENKLNPKDSSDSSTYQLDKHYTNIEVYLHSLL